MTRLMTRLTRPRVVTAADLVIVEQPEGLVGTVTLYAAYGCPRYVIELFPATDIEDVIATARRASADAWLVDLGDPVREHTLGDKRLLIFRPVTL